MKYRYPNPRDEWWLRTKPSSFVFSPSCPEDAIVPLEVEGGGSGVHLLTIAQARESFPHVLLGCGGKVLDSDLSAFIEDNAHNGLFFYVDPSAPNRVEVSLRAALAEGLSRVSKSLIVVAPGKDVTLVEKLSDAGGDQLLSSLRVIVGAEAHFVYRRHWQWRRKVYHEARFTLAEGARLDLVTLAANPVLNKVEQEVKLLGAESRLEEIFVDLARTRSHFDIATRVDHQAPRTCSRLEMRGVVWDKAYSIHHGLVRVGDSALGADTHFRSRHLLLTPRGRADTIPKLEIATDQVKAGHGATVSDVDPDSIYYLRTRGLSEEQARALLVEGFLEPLFRNFPDISPSREVRLAS